MHKNAAPLGVLWIAALALAGCATGAGPGAPAVALPAQWATPASGPPQADAQADAVTPAWWRSFGSAELDGLVAQARAGNFDLAAAAARVAQAEAQARQAGARLLPEVTGAVNAARQGQLGGDAAVDGTRLGVALSASYEVDVWGRLGATRDGAQAALRASVFDQEAVRLSISAGVAHAWLQGVALRERQDIAALNLRSAERLLALVAARQRAGAASALELAQQRGLVAAQRRAHASVRQQADAAQTALALLMGQAGRAASATAALQGLRVPSVAAEVPAALLARRPDIARAEAHLAAAQANVAAARAAMLPGLTLGASLGTGGDRLERAFDNPVYALAAALAAPIFDAGRRATGHELAQAQREELLAAYRRTVVQAYGDVQNALDAAAGADAQMQAQAEVVAQARQAFALSESRYRAGADTLLTLLDAQRALYAAQDEAVQLQLARLQARVALYKALGGGWLAPEGAAS